MNTYLSTTLLLSATLAFSPAMAQLNNQVQRNDQQQEMNAAPQQNNYIQSNVQTNVVNRGNPANLTNNVTGNSNPRAQQQRVNTTPNVQVVNEVFYDNGNANDNDDGIEVNDIPPLQQQIDIQNQVQTQATREPRERRDRSANANNANESIRAARTPRIRVQTPTAEPEATPEPNAWANRMAARGSSASGGNSNTNRRKSHYGQGRRAHSGRKLLNSNSSRPKRVKSNRDCFAWNS
jgi:hypothetical protein